MTAGSVLLGGPSSSARSALEEQRRRGHVRVLASRVVLVIAVLGLLSAAVHPLWQRMGFVRDLMPGLVMHTARPTLVLVSVILLLTARGLRRGHRLAWIATIATLAVSVVVHLAKGPDVVSAVVVAAGAVWLASQGRAFPVLPTRRQVRWAIIWVVAAVVFLVVLFVGLVVWALVADPTDEQIDHLGRVLAPVTYLLTVVFVVALLWSLLSPRRPHRLSPEDHRDERERARLVVQRHGGGTLDYFALRDDKDWFFSGASVVAHSVRGGVCLVSPDPIGPADEKLLAWAEFLDYADDFGWSVTVIGAAADWLRDYESSGLRTVYLGDEAIVDCSTFSLEGRSHKSLRQAVNRVERAGYATTFHDPAALDPTLRAQIEAMSDESRHGDTERGFSMTLSRLFQPDDTGLMLSVTRDPAGRVDAFVQWVPATDIGGWSLDVMRRRTDTEGLPNGLIDSTIVATIAYLASRGERGLGLNFAMMREVLEGDADGTAEGSRLDSLARPILQRLSQGTQMGTLSTFNEKFDPGWVPRYVVLDSVEFVATQALVLAGAEGVTEIPVIGRFLGEHRRGLVIVAILAAVISSIAYGVSTIMQAVATRKAAGLAVIKQPLVIAAFVVDGLAWVLSLVALDKLPLFVVQAIIASSLVVVVILARFVLGTRMRPIDRVAVIVVVGALVLVSLAGGEQPAVAPPDGFVTIMIVASAALVVLTAVFYKAGPPVVLGVLGGLGYSGAAIAARAATESGGFVATVFQPLAIAIVLCAIAGALSYLRALERGSVGTAAAIVSVLEVVIPGVVGIAVLGDKIRDGWVPAAVVGTLLALAGCIALALSPANAAAEASAEERELSPPA